MEWWIIEMKNEGEVVGVGRGERERGEKGGGSRRGLWGRRVMKNGG